MILATEIGRRASLAIENARAYTEAREAVRTRDNFLAIASHELRTPLSALSVLISSLVRAAASGRLLKLTPQALSDRMTKAERQTTQLGRLVDRLLDVSRLSTRDLALERERTDLADIARDVISRYEDAAAETGSRIELSDRRADGRLVGPQPPRSGGDEPGRQRREVRTAARPSPSRSAREARATCG